MTGVFIAVKEKVHYYETSTQSPVCCYPVTLLYAVCVLLETVDVLLFNVSVP